jgi:predicted metal-dependent hydrolase
VFEQLRLDVEAAAKPPVRDSGPVEGAPGEPGGSAGIIVVRSPRARGWRLEVPWGEPVRLTVPRRTTEAEVDAILDGKRGWIERQRALQVPRLGLERLGLTEREARRLARERVTDAAEREAPRIGVEFTRIDVRGQRTLWGSCSPRGTLSFNWRLALAPPEVLEYVVVHELCHLEVPSHSRRFWSLVARHRPSFRCERDWLREFGEELLAFRPA